MHFLTQSQAITQDDKINSMLGQFVQKRYLKQQLNVHAFNNPAPISDAESHVVIVANKTTDAAQQIVSSLKGLEDVFTHDVLCLSDVVNALNSKLATSKRRYSVLAYDEEKNCENTDAQLNTIAQYAADKKVHVLTTTYLHQLSQQDKRFIFDL